MLIDLIKVLPGLYCIVIDCDYSFLDNLVSIFGGASAKIACIDNFNYFAYQCYIRIEMAFGFMVKK